MVSNILFDRPDELWNTVKDPSPELVDGKVTKESLDHIEPRGTGWSKMKVKAGITLLPRLHFRMFMGSIVVANDVNLLRFWCVTSNQVKKANPLLVSMLLHAGGNDLSISNVHGREK